MIAKFLALPRNIKRVISVTADVILLSFAFWSALALHLETLEPVISLYKWQMVVAPLIAIPVFIRLGLYRAVIRYMEDRVVFVVVAGVTISVVSLAALVTVMNASQVSVSVLSIYWLLAIVYVGASRFLARSWFLSAQLRRDNRKRVAIYGAGSAGTQLACALRAGRECFPVLFIDDDLSVQKTEVAGLRVYASADLQRVLADGEIDEVLLAIPSANRSRRLEIIDQLERLHRKVKLVPSMADIVGGKITGDTIREVDIEDLLGRDTVPPNPSLLGCCIAGKVVLVEVAPRSWTEIWFS